MLKVKDTFVRVPTQYFPFFDISRLFDTIEKELEPPGGVHKYPRPPPFPLSQKTAPMKASCTFP